MDKTQYAQHERAIRANEKRNGDNRENGDNWETATAEHNWEMEETKDLGLQRGSGKAGCNNNAHIAWTPRRWKWQPQRRKTQEKFFTRGFRPTKHKTAELKGSDAQEKMDLMGFYQYILPAHLKSRHSSIQNHCHLHWVQRKNEQWNFRRNIPTWQRTQIVQNPSVHLRRTHSIKTIRLGVSELVSRWVSPAVWNRRLMEPELISSWELPARS